MKVELSESAVLLLPSLTKQLTFTITPANASNKKVRWTSSNQNIATVDTAGLVRAISNGEVSIIAASIDNISLSDTTRLIVLQNYDVYAVGHSNTNQFSKQAIYWNNETPQVLSGGYVGGFDANAIEIAGNDIFIAGTTTNQNGWTIPTVWKNGVPTQLTNPLNEFQHFVTGIDVDGGDVYVSGWDFDMVECPNCRYVTHGHFWKTSGGTVTDIKLFDDSSNSGANDVLIKDAKVFVAGWQANDNFFRRSKLWTDNFSNGTEFTSGSFAEGMAIAAKGNDFYIAGYEECGSTTCIQIAKLWKTDGSSSLQITDGSHHAKINAIGIQGDDIILAGFEKNDAGKYVAKYWRVHNGTVTSHQIGNGDTDSMINSVVIAGNEIFLAGFETNAVHGRKQARYWRAIDGLNLAVDLYVTTPGTGDSELKGIAIK